MTCRLYIGVDDGHGIDAAFFRDQVSPEHALDVLTRCYPDSGAARAFVDTLGAARAPDDEDGPAADPRPDGVLVLSDVDMFLCEADALWVGAALLHHDGVWTMYGRDDLHAATARLMDRMHVDEWTAQTHLPVIRSIIATGSGPEDLALLLDLEDMIGVGIDHAILARLIRWYGREFLRRIIDGQNGPDFPLSCVTSTVIHMYAARAWRQGAIRGFSESHEGFNADYADGQEDPDVKTIVDRWDNPYGYV